MLIDQRDRQIDDAGLLGAERVGHRESRRSALAHPRQEAQVGIGIGWHRRSTSAGRVRERARSASAAPPRLSASSAAWSSLQRAHGRLRPARPCPSPSGTMVRTRRRACSRPRGDGALRKRARPMRRIGARAAAPLRKLHLRARSSGQRVASSVAAASAAACVVDDDRLVLERRGDACAASKLARVAAEDAARHPSSSNDGPRASRRRSSRRTAPARTVA